MITSPVYSPSLLARFTRNVSPSNVSTRAVVCWSVYSSWVQGCQQCQRGKVCEVRRLPVCTLCWPPSPTHTSHNLLSCTGCADASAGTSCSQVTVTWSRSRHHSHVVTITWYCSCHHLGNSTVDVQVGREITAWHIHLRVVWPHCQFVH